MTTTVAVTKYLVTFVCVRGHSGAYSDTRVYSTLGEAHQEAMDLRDRLFAVHAPYIEISNFDVNRYEIKTPASNGEMKLFGFIFVQESRVGVSV